MKAVFGIAFLIIITSVLTSSAADKKDLSANTLKETMITDVLAVPQEPAGERVARMAYIVLKGITDIAASDSNDSEKNEAVSLGLANAIVYADKSAEQLMTYVVAQLDEARWVQISAGVISLSDRGDKDAILDGVLTQVGPDTRLGQLARSAASAPVSILGQRVQVLVGRTVSPAKSLGGDRQAGGARTLPLPPIRRAEAPPPPTAPRALSVAPPEPPPERPPVDPYPGQKK